MVNTKTKFFAATLPTGQFSFSSIREKKRDVFILDSEAKYGGVIACGISISVVDLDFSDDLESFEDRWKVQKIAWIWQNFDGSFWMDSLSKTRIEARSHSSKPEIMEACGAKVVQVMFSLIDKRQ